MMPTLFIIAGCNGAGKTTAARTLLPDVLGVKEFVNADAIAAGLSPFNVESVAIQAGKLMLERIDFLLKEQKDFAIETTLSSKTYVNLVKQAQSLDFEVFLIYFWLENADLAIQRVKDRVKNGGHSIPEDVIKRRYARGIENLVKLFLPIVDEWLLVNNAVEPPQRIAENLRKDDIIIYEEPIFEKILNYGNV